MKEAIYRMYESRGYYVRKEWITGITSSSWIVRYLRVDVYARMNREYIYFECETRLDLDKLKTRSIRLDVERTYYLLVLALPIQAYGDGKWVPELKGYYDQIMVYSSERGWFTQVIYLGPRRPRKSQFKTFNNIDPVNLARSRLGRKWLHQVGRLPKGYSYTP
jgi:hypothetical protein